MSSAIRERLKPRTKEYDKTYKHLKKKEPIANAKAKTVPPASKAKAKPRSKQGPETSDRMLAQQLQSSSDWRGASSSSSGGMFGTPGALKKAMQRMQSKQFKV